VGYAFSVVIVQWTVSALLFTALPEIHYSNLSNWPPLSEDETLIAEAGIQEFWVPTLTYQILVYLINPLLNIVDIWLLVLSVIIVSIFNDVSWGKAATISISAFILRLFLKVFLFL
jgi:hypothetical protein